MLRGDCCGVAVQSGKGVDGSGPEKTERCAVEKRGSSSRLQGKKVGWRYQMRPLSSNREIGRLHLGSCLLQLLVQTHSSTDICRPRSCSVTEHTRTQQLALDHRMTRGKDGRLHILCRCVGGCCINRDSAAHLQAGSCSLFRAGGRIRIR